MAWALFLVALGAPAALERLASPPLLCRLGIHLRARGSTGGRWVCRRCPAMHGAATREARDEG